MMDEHAPENIYKYLVRLHHLESVLPVSQKNYNCQY
jgi:hypothetical protein